jgi:hypothetical protein
LVKVDFDLTINHICLSVSVAEMETNGNGNGDVGTPDSKKRKVDSSDESLPAKKVRTDEKSTDKVPEVEEVYLD